MQLTHFRTLRAGVQANAAPAATGPLVAMADQLRTLLEGSGFCDSVEVEHTADPDRLVVGLGTYRPFLGEQQVVDLLQRVWNERLCYPFWEVHTIIVDAGHVELEAATRQSVLGHYVTMHVVLQRATVPAQRRPDR